MRTVLYDCTVLFGRRLPASKKAMVDSPPLWFMLLIGQLKYSSRCDILLPPVRVTMTGPSYLFLVAYSWPLSLGLCASRRNFRGYEGYACPIPAF